MAGPKISIRDAYRKIALGLLSICIGAKAYEYYTKAAARRKKWKQIEEDRLEAIRCYQLKHPEVTKDQQQIVDLSAEGLTRSLLEEKLTAVEVLEAFIAEVVNIGRKHSAGRLEIIDDAIRIAQDLDRLKPSDRRPLHGVPVLIQVSNRGPALENLASLINH